MRSKVKEQLSIIIPIPDSVSEDELHCLQKQKIQSLEIYKPKFSKITDRLWLIWLRIVTT